MWKSQGALVDYCYFGVIFLSLQKNHKFFVVVVDDDDDSLLSVDGITMMHLRF